MVLIIIIGLLLINLWVFMPFFNLGLFGDDWLTIFRYSYYLDASKHLGPYSSEYFNNFKYLFNAYGTQDTIMAMLYKAFGIDSNAYFIVSYILRIGAGLSIYLPTFYLTKSKLAALFAVFFFIFSTTGIDASGWVFNMPSYLTISFFSIFLYLYLLSHYENKRNYLLLSYLFFFLSFTSNLIRSHGLIPFVIFIEILWLSKERSWKIAKSALIRISGFLLIFLLIYLLGFRETISGNALVSLKGGITTTVGLLSQGRFDFLFYPVVTLGSMLVPDSFVPHGWNITSFSQYLFKIFLPIFLIFSVITIILGKSIKNLNSIFLRLTSQSGVIWAILVAIIYKFNLITLSNAQSVSFLLIGGLLCILVIAIIICLKSSSFVKISLLIPLGWTLISFLFPWWTNPGYIYITTHRYLIVSSMGISLLLAGIIGLGKNKKAVITMTCISAVFLLLHALYTKNYIDRLYLTHSGETVKKIWSQMPYIPEVGQSTEPLIFYFESDGSNAAILGDSVGFGFPFHMALLYKITETNKTPISMIEWKEVESAVLDGKSLGKYTGNKITTPVPPERIYAFHLQGKDNLINITDIARQKLRGYIQSKQ